MLEWETVDLEAVYPRARYRAIIGDPEDFDRLYELSWQPAGGGWWHLRQAIARQFGRSRDLHTLEIAKGVAETWEAEAAIASERMT